MVYTPEDFKEVNEIKSDPYALQWTTKDGRSMLACEMTDSHLTNSIMYLKRKSYYSQAPKLQAIVEVLEYIGLERGLSLCI